MYAKYVVELYVHMISTRARTFVSLVKWHYAKSVELIFLLDIARSVRDLYVRTAQ